MLIAATDDWMDPSAHKSMLSCAMYRGRMMVDSRSQLTETKPLATSKKRVSGQLPGAFRAAGTSPIVGEIKVGHSLVSIHCTSRGCQDISSLLYSLVSTPLHVVADHFTPLALPGFRF